MAIRTGTVLVKELAATPATPASGDLAIYGKTDGKLYYENDGGTEHALVGTSDTQMLSGKSFADLVNATNGVNTKLAVAKLAADAPGAYPQGLSTASVITRRNVIRNPGASNATYWSNIGGASHTRAVDTTFGHEGTDALKFTLTATGTLGGKAHTDPVTDPFVAGDTVRWSIWVYATRAVSWQPYWERIGGTYRGSSAGSAVAVPANTWTKLTGSVTFDSTNATEPGVTTYHGFGAYSGGWVSGDTFWLDEVVAEKNVSEVGAYFDGDTGAASWTGTVDASASTWLNGFPAAGVLLTISQEAARNYTVQLLGGQSQAATYKRHSSDGSTWSAWSRLVFEDDTQTFTNKTISGASNNLSAIPTAALADGAVTTIKIADGAITTAKMATDPYARANHTGTQAASTISNFDTQVRTNRLDQMAAPTAAVSMNSQRLTTLAAPVNVGDAARLAEIDAIDNKPSVYVATTANINLATNGLTGIDGYSLSEGTRVLVKDQITTSENGLYAATAGTWTRTTDYLTRGTLVMVELGTVNGQSLWTLADSSAMTWVQLAGPALPKGIIAAWTIAANTNTVTTAAERMMITFSFTALASRAYRIMLSGGLVDSESTVAQSAFCTLRWQQGSAVTTASAACGRQIVATPASTNGDLASGVHVEGLITTATAGTVNVGWSLTAANGVNTVRYFATSIPPRVYVQDVGPSLTVNSLSFV